MSILTTLPMRWLNSRKKSLSLRVYRKQVGKGNTSEILSPSATIGKDQGPSSHSTGPPAAKGKGKASANVDPPPVRRSPRR
ncbi:hypothetical protein Bca52824_066462 [Brassica carinata]|uniref:Uncharacterized protein n=1 Tax=Brassica carinata TaxID=52824 RepID=A0A8X7UAM8_BRACI|nr:hypothetical protein Bca52824_066462 [Brassica carinata]